MQDLVESVPSSLTGVRLNKRGELVCQLLSREHGGEVDVCDV